ncbi:MAG: T9SS C-terminal target domain-containing protein, partial [Bacteroidales bacterium]|nr:T9SS C-terminal target domain-containing protein [Bacteroidales bacterium]
MKHLYLLLLGGVFCLNIFAGEPVIRVDLNISGRSESEVNEPDYTPWVVATQSKDSLSLSGVEFVLTAIHPEGSLLKTGWSKLHIQAPYLARLANDGVTNSFSGGGDLELRIRGLAIGEHSLQSYHNTWSNPDNNVFCPFNVYLNGKLVHENILRSNRVEVNAHATTLYTKFEVEYEGQEVVFLFESDKDFSSDEKKVSDTTALKEVEISVTINGFELNTPQTAKQATEPYPLDKDMHTDTDSGFLDLMWKPAENSEKSILFYSTDSSAVAAADSSCKLAELSSQDSTYRVENLYSMNVYYWKVNQEDEAGNLTQGQVWSFRPRQLAFRGAEGYGRHAIGGRGGKVVYVTNLNDDGPGSFREAVTNDIGPRTILFNVSGIIQL